MKYKNNRERFENEYWYKQAKEKTILKRERRIKRRIERGKYDFGKYQLTGAKNSLYQASLKRNATKAEIIFGDFLWNNKIYFYFQKGFFTPFHRIVDFYLPDYNLIIEIDGGYHKNIIKKDQIKDYRWFEERKKSTLRITNEEVYNGLFKEKILFLNSNIWTK